MAGIPIEIIVFASVLLIIIACAPLLGGGNRKQMRKRASKLQQRVKTQPHTKEGQSDEQARQSLRKIEGDTSLPLLTELLKRLPNIRVLRDRLARSGTTITAERYLVYNGLLFIVVALLMWLIVTDSGLLAAFVGIIIGLGLPHVVISFKISRRAKRFLTLFPDAIDLIVRGLRAGLPVTESIKMVAKEIQEPVGTIFQVMTDKMALGVTLEKTLYETAAKFRITEFDFFVTSVVLQRETGGNLSEILANLSEALRQRLVMQMKIKAMSSEAKASMYIISALPFFVIGALAAISPDYLIPLVHDYRGNIALAIAGGMMSTGVFIMFRMTKFEI